MFCLTSPEMTVLRQSKPNWKAWGFHCNCRRPSPGLLAGIPEKFDSVAGLSHLCLAGGVDNKSQLNAVLELKSLRKPRKSLQLPRHGDASKAPRTKKDSRSRANSQRLRPSILRLQLSVCFGHCPAAHSGTPGAEIQNLRLTAVSCVSPSFVSRKPTADKDFMQTTLLASRNIRPSKGSTSNRDRKSNGLATPSCSCDGMFRLRQCCCPKLARQPWIFIRTLHWVPFSSSMWRMPIQIAPGTLSRVSSLGFAFARAGDRNCSTDRCRQDGKRRCCRFELEGDTSKCRAQQAHKQSPHVLKCLANVSLKDGSAFCPGSEAGVLLLQWAPAVCTVVAQLKRIWDSKLLQRDVQAPFEACASCGESYMPLQPHAYVYQNALTRSCGPCIRKQARTSQNLSLP